jgi:TPR repeat protein
MSGRATGGAAAKRQRLPLEEEEAAEPAALQMTARPKVPLPLLSVAMWLRGTLVWLQLCNPQGVALFSLVRPPPRVPCPFAGARVYGMSLTHAERLRVVGCGYKGRLVRLLSLGTGHHFEQQRNSRKMMQTNVRRVAAGLAAAVLERALQDAERLLATGQNTAAAAQLQRAIDLGHLPSRAHLADLFIHDREGFARDRARAFVLAEEGARLGCHHCQGVLAYCHLSGIGCYVDFARYVPLARESAAKGSKYCQFLLGLLYVRGWAGARDYAAAFAHFRLAAAQGYDVAQHWLGYMYCETYICDGRVVAQDHAEALRWYKLAAAQGYGEALNKVGHFYEMGFSVAADKAEAIRWYKRAQAVGDPIAAHSLRRLARETCSQ